MDIALWIGLLHLWAFFGLDSAAIFTAVFQLKDAFHNEGTALSLVEGHMENPEFKTLEDENLLTFDTFIRLATKNHKAGVAVGEPYMEHPVNIYHVIRRMADDWPKYIKLISEVEDKKIEELYNKLKALTEDESKWPTSRDRLGVTTQLIRTQALYLLDIHELATGTLNRTHTDPLTLEEIFEIANHASDRSMFYEAVLWFEGLLKELQGGAAEKGYLTITKAVKALAGAYFRYGNYKKAVGVIEDALKKDPNDKKLQTELAYYKEKLQNKEAEGEEVERPLGPVVSEDRVFHHKYFSMCRGDVKKKETVQKKLKCVFRKTSVPYRPAKVEIMNRSPLIIMFHDVIYDDEIKQVKSTTKENMSRSTIHGSKDATNIKVDTRISMTSWNDDSSRLFAKLSRRVAEKTGLSTKSLETASHAEFFQVLNYGIGGMYEPHHDYFDIPNPHTLRSTLNSGDRLATWMFYISDVKVGGNTVFPLSDTTISPVKGAAAFWPNKFLNGSVDPRTLHAGCPVVIGSKWVMNKWILEWGQFDKWNCPRRRLVTTPWCKMTGKKC